jgi:putative transposase
LVYHIISRTALDGYVISDGDKDYFVDLIKQMSKVYFVEVLGFSIMSNHFHLIVRMKNDESISDEEIREGTGSF